MLALLLILAIAINIYVCRLHLQSNILPPLEQHSAGTFQHQKHQKVN